MKGCRCAGTCPKCKEAAKQAKVAALRQRLEDIAAGARRSEMPHSAFSDAVASVFNVEGFYLPDPFNPDHLTELAAWLWESQNEQTKRGRQA